MPIEPLKKSPSGIRGLDEITVGGLPLHRATLVCGGAGSGKTLFASTFVLEGALKYAEPGVFVCFEETEEELAQNLASLGYDLQKLIREGKIAVDFIRVAREEILETGDYDLDGLFIRIDAAIKSVGAKRVALDSLEALFAGFENQALLRSELRRLFHWLKDREVTAVVTGERGEAGLTRRGLEEYVSDCVILLDHRVAEQVATRRLRVVKYRGGAHGVDEYPFLIDSDGVSVLPITSLQLAHEAPREFVATGVEGLDSMLDGKGFWRASSVLVSGAAGTGKTTIAARFVEAACRRGERASFFSFEESPSQIMRNMLSVGIDLKPWADAGLLRLSASRPTFWGLETHLAQLHKEIDGFSPQIVVVDPIYNLNAVGTRMEVHAMLLRLIDYLKSRGVTAMLTTIDVADGDAEHARISSLMDTWIQVRMTESDGERNRSIYVLKARGVAHSNQIREFVLSADGLALREAYLGPGGVLTGSARTAQEGRDAQLEAHRRLEAIVKEREALRHRRQIEAQIAALQAELAEQEGEIALLRAQALTESDAAARVRDELAVSRGAGR